MNDERRDCFVATLLAMTPGREMLKQVQHDEIVRIEGELNGRN